MKWKRRRGRAKGFTNCSSKLGFGENEKGQGRVGQVSGNMLSTLMGFLAQSYKHDGFLKNDVAKPYNMIG